MQDPTQEFPIDLSVVKRARRLAAQIVNPIVTEIKQYSTVGIERCVARFLGVGGINEAGVPFANVLVDHVQKVGMLGYGVAGWLETVGEEKSWSPQLVAEMISVGSFAAPVKKLDGPARDSVLDPFVNQGIQNLQQKRVTRKAFRKSLRLGSTPLKYLIVATGNIYEDTVQAQVAAEQGADIIAVIRSTAQSLLDYVPFGETTVGFGGTYATQENFSYIRKALDETSLKLGRYIQLVNYSSGLCMAEIAYLAAIEGLDMVLNDAMYGILFRDINAQRTFTDQYFSRLICAHNEITINTGEDNYLTTADAMTEGYQILSSQFLNEQFALAAGIEPQYMGLGHAFEIDPQVEDSFIHELAGALLVREIFPKSPLKYMPPTKYMTGDIFKGYLQNGLFNLVAKISNQGIILLGMLTEHIHTPFMQDRALAIDNANYAFNAVQSMAGEIIWRKDGKLARRMTFLLDEAMGHLQKIADAGLYAAIEDACFAEISRAKTGGKGLNGVFLKAEAYKNPMLDYLEKQVGGKS